MPPPELTVTVKLTVVPLATYTGLAGDSPLIVVVVELAVPVNVPVTVNAPVVCVVVASLNVTASDTAPVPAVESVASSVHAVPTATAVEVVTAMPEAAQPLLVPPESEKALVLAPVCTMPVAARLPTSVTVPSCVVALLVPSAYVTALRCTCVMLVLCESAL